MRSGEDDAAFDAVIQDLCLAFNRPHTAELTRVFWESLKWAHIGDIRMMASKARATLKKFPSPKDLAPEKAAAPPPRMAEDPPELSSLSMWARGANRILLELMMARGRREKVQSLGRGLALVLRAKADFVIAAEEAEGKGEPWIEREFIDAVRDGLGGLLA